MDQHDDNPVDGWPAGAGWEQLVAHAPVGLFQTDAAGACTYVNRAWCDITGLEPKQALGHGWVSALHPEDRETVVQGWRQAAATVTPFEAEYRFQDPEGTSTWVLGRAAPVREDDGELVGYAGSITNIEDRKAAEEALVERESRFRDVADQAPVMIGATDADGHITFLNKTWLDFRGKTLEEEEGWAWAAGLHPEDRERTISEMERRIGRREPYSVEYRIEDRNGDHHWMLDTAIPRIDRQGKLLGYIGTAVVIDAHKQLEGRLRSDVAEREALLREVHHRVKNNLQIVSSLIFFQSQKAPRQEEQALFEELRSRLLAMSLVHEKLYQSQQLSAVDLGDYIGSLVDSLRATIVHGDRLEFSLEAGELRLPLEKALPAGMIVSELITNVGKHAFGGEARVHCGVTIGVADGDAVIRVMDDGVGFPAGFDPHSNESFGWELIRSLVDQLGGGFEIEAGVGAAVRFWFPANGDPPRDRRPATEGST